MALRQECLETLSSLLTSQICELIYSYIPKPWGYLNLSFSIQGITARIKLISSKIRCGRSQTSDLILPHLAASRQHCIFTVEEHNLIFLEDCSTNGMFVNKKALKKNEKILIHHLDEIIFVQSSHVSEDTLYGVIYLENYMYQFGDYYLHSLIGTGSFAYVYLCTHVRTKQQYAMKLFKPSVRSTKPFYQERKVLESIHHNLIVTLIDSIENEKENLYALIFEYIPGKDLLDCILEHPCGFAEIQAKKIFVQILRALEYLHSREIAHRDIKPENVVLIQNTENQIKLIDFGLAAHDRKFMNTVCGTPKYVAPEVVTICEQPKPQTSMGYTKEVDLWSLGVVLYALLTGMVPFDENRNIFAQIKSGRYLWPSLPKPSTEAVDLVDQLLQVNVQNRITIEKIFQHPWLK